MISKFKLAYKYITNRFYNNKKAFKRMSFNKTLSIRRKEKDIFKLRSSQYKVIQTEQTSTWHIQFVGPKDTPYQKGKWLINLYLPDEYPYKSPSVGFLNKIYHPNIDYGSGSVCLDVINQTWTPMYQLVNIFQIFLPQLLTYPNPSSPLNHDAAQIFQKNIEQYNKKVRQNIVKHALNQQFKQEQPKIQQQQHEKQQSESEGICSLSDRNSSLDQNDELHLY